MPDAPAGFDGGENFQYTGDNTSLPDWAKEWGSWHGSDPCQSVPRGDPLGQPYSTVDAMKDDWVFANTDQTRFAVVKNVAVEVAAKVTTATTPPPDPPVVEDAGTTRRGGRR